MTTGSPRRINPGAWCQTWKTDDGPAFAGAPPASSQIAPSAAPTRTMRRCRNATTPEERLLFELLGVKPTRHDHLVPVAERLLRLPDQTTLLPEPELPVQRDRRLVVRIDLERDLLDAHLAGPPHREGHERRPDPLAPPRSLDGHAERRHVAVHGMDHSFDRDEADHLPPRHRDEPRPVVGPRIGQGAPVVLHRADALGANPPF